MPTYEYVCLSCGTHVEVFQRFADEPLTACAVCGGQLRKVFHPAGIMFKGSGFYSNDSRKGSSKVSASTNSGSDGSKDGSARESTGSGSEPSSSSGSKASETSGGSEGSAKKESTSSKPAGPSSSGSSSSSGKKEKPA